VGPHAGQVASRLGPGTWDSSQCLPARPAVVKEWAVLDLGRGGESLSLPAGRRRRLPRIAPRAPGDLQYAGPRRPLSGALCGGAPEEPNTKTHRMASFKKNLLVPHVGPRPSPNPSQVGACVTRKVTGEICIMFLAYSSSED